MKTEQNNYYKNNMNETIKQIMLDQIEELELKLASAHEQIMRLEKAGDGLVAGAGAVNMWERIKVWDTTKENKAINNMTTTEQNNKQRVFVFTTQPSEDWKNRPIEDWKSRPMLYAFPEDQIHSIQSQKGSENCYLKVNGIEVKGSFEKLIEMLGERVDFK